MFVVHGHYKRLLSSLEDEKWAQVNVSVCPRFVYSFRSPSLSNGRMTKASNEYVGPLPL